MERHFQLIGDKQPDKNRVHLPSWEKKEDVYGRYKGGMLKIEISESSIVGLSTFYRIWNENFANVVIPEVGFLLIIVVSSQYVLSHCLLSYRKTGFPSATAVSVQPVIVAFQDHHIAVFNFVGN